ncbi:hypothetical protein MIS45_02570 [Wielerella bovis]|uniref:hypothetical protein n=1 Tax=Wielerella bovis TaxID=2917790 RepID=UPI0020194161|nr:hypothetical protein [Wielerella bovis]ULJ69753.1 hypothetical protein MIS45_02570 [Wielerella bovis]
MFRISRLWLMIWIFIGGMLPFAIWYGDGIGVAHETQPLRIWGVASILTCLFGLLFQVENDVIDEYGILDTEHRSPLFMLIVGFLSVLFGMTGWVTLIFAIAISFAPERIVAAKMGGVHISGSRGRICKTWIEQSEMAELIGHSFRVTWGQCYQIKRNSNVKLSVHKNVAGMSVEVLEE